MATINTWILATGEGDDSLGTWYNPSSFYTYVPADSPRSPFRSNVFPRRIKNAGLFGLGSSGDPDPLGGTSKDILWIGWVQFEFFTFIFPSGFVGGDTVFWKLPPGLSVYYRVGV